MESKCVQFILPSGAGGMAAQMAAGNIKKKLNEYVSNNQLSQYKTTHQNGYRMNVWFEDEKSITIFCLLWEIEKPFQGYTIVTKSIEENPFISQTKK